MSYEFAKATVVEAGDGSLTADVSCLNGLSAPPETTYTLPDAAVYHDGEAIEAGQVILFRISNSGVLDASHIFPYNPNTGNPNRMGGGIGKGNIIEEDEALASEKPTDPGVSVTWVNGLNADGDISAVTDEGAYNLDVGTEVYFLTVFNGEGVAEVISVAVSEGTCGDVPSGPPEYTFGSVGQTAV